MNNPLDAVGLRCELALLDCPLDENVVTFLERCRNARKISIERQIVPIGVLLGFAVGVLVPVAFAETDIGHGRSRRKVSEGRLRRNIAEDFEMISLHGYCSPCSR
jgi:hypothetical protein